MSVRDIASIGLTARRRSSWENHSQLQYSPHPCHFPSTQLVIRDNGELSFIYPEHTLGGERGVQGRRFMKRERDVSYTCARDEVCLIIVDATLLTSKL